MTQTTINNESIYGDAISVGADPELFVFDEDQNKYLSAHDIFPGTKEIPFDIGPGAIQVDGTAFEFNIPPSSTSEEFSLNIDKMIAIGNGMLRKQSPKLVLKDSPVVLYDEDYFKELPPYAKELGCTPDYSAYTSATNDKPSIDLPMRTGSGHVHIGWTDNADTGSQEHFFDCKTVVKNLDVSLYIPSLLWGSDKEDLRRKLYGKPGSFRPKFYGVEYRVLSNSWVDVPELREFVFDTVAHTMKLLQSGKYLHSTQPFMSKIHGVVFRNEPIDFNTAERLHEELVFLYNFPVLPDLS